MGLTKYKLGELIEQRREKYSKQEKLPVRGVSKDGFINAKIADADTSLYNVFYLNDFVFNPARMEINSIAFNTQWEKAICSSLYEIFFITRQDILLPEYLNLFVKRDEFARRCEFIGWGSAREYCRVENISDTDIYLPPLSIQQKYVDIYNAMVTNQHCYEQGLSDLKFSFEDYIDDLRTNGIIKPIGQYIEQVEVRNINNLYGANSVKGISIEKKFIDTKADMQGVNLNRYYIIEPDDFAYVPVTSRNGGKISIAINDSDKSYICSSSYIVFKCIDINKLYPQYLMLNFLRDEFDRYARFNSWGSARETFSFDDMCDVRIPIPDINIQKAISEIYSVYNERKKINERLKEQIRSICPILIKGSLEEASA